jgi:uncharacterized protein YbaP (TraB family)
MMGQGSGSGGIEAMRTAVKWLGAALLVLAAAPGWAAPAGPRESAPVARGGPRPAIWLLADADTKIYLFGTYHILPRGFQWRSPLFNDIVRRADALVVEVTQDEARDNLAGEMTRLQLGKRVPLTWRVSPARRRALTEMVESLGVPMATFDNLQTWGAAMMLAVVQTVRGMARGEADEAATAAADGNAAPGDAPAPTRAAWTEAISGVEQVLEAEFRASNRPISGVETVAQQMGVFASLTFADQRRMLEQMVDAYRKSGSDGPVEIGEGDWARGNVDAVALRRDAAQNDPFYEAILPRRNAAWTAWLAARMERPGTLLFAVGAAHLAGPDSVQTMLAARGLTVRRIQ